MKQKSLEILKTVNSVDGLNPESLSVIGYNDDGTPYEYLPVPLQRKWFFLKHPNGKIVPQTPQKLTDNVLIITVRVYADKADPDEQFIGMGSKLFTLNDLERQITDGDTAFERTVTMCTGRALSDAGFDIVQEPNNELKSMFPDNSPKTLDEACGETPMPQQTVIPQQPTMSVSDNATEPEKKKRGRPKKDASTTAPLPPTPVNDTLNFTIPTGVIEEADFMETVNTTPIPSVSCQPVAPTPSMTNVITQDATSAIFDTIPVPGNELDNAFATPCTFNTYKGMTLKDVYEQEKAMISYFVSNPKRITEAEYIASKVICKQDAELMAKLARQGITL